MLGKQIKLRLLRSCLQEVQSSSFLILLVRLLSWLKDFLASYKKYVHLVTSAMKLLSGSPIGVGSLLLLQSRQWVTTCNGFGYVFNLQGGCRLDPLWVLHAQSFHLHSHVCMVPFPSVRSFLFWKLPHFKDLFFSQDLGFLFTGCLHSMLFLTEILCMQERDMLSAS